jgi:cytochrome c-type biogenesis protein CcmH
VSVLRSTGFRRWSWLVIIALVVVSLARNELDGGSPASADDRVRAIAQTLKCPVCRSQSVADSDVAAARAIRTEIAKRVDEGEGDDEIRDAIAATYGDDVQLTPERGGFSGLVWVLPVVALVLALAGLSAAFARWRRRVEVTTTDADRALVDQALVDQALVDQSLQDR